MPRKAKNTRRGNKEGSIYQRSDGRWCGQVLLGYKNDGKPNRKTFYGATREEVAEKITNISSDNFRGIPYIEPQNMTVKELVTEWLFNFKKSEVSPRTFEWYMNITNVHIFKELGGFPIKKLTTYHIQILLNKCMNNGLQLRMLKAIRSILNQSLQYACEMNLLGANPTLNTKLPKTERKVREKEKIIPVYLRKQVLDAAENEVLMKPAIITLMFTGMRAGELLALPWKNVDFENKTIHIDRAVTQASDYELDGTRKSRKTIISTTKTFSGDRKIKIPDIVGETLKEWYALQKDKNVSFVDDETTVFPNKRGQCYTYGGFLTIYRRFLKKHGLPDSLNIHRYRHNLASMLLEQGVNPRVVQKMLGHSDIETTLGIYSHVLAEVYDGVADTLGNIYSTTIDGSYKPKAIS